MLKVLTKKSGIENKYLSIQETATILHVSRFIVYRWIQLGWIPSYRIGLKFLRIHSEDIKLLCKTITQLRQDNPLGNRNNRRPGVVARSLSFPSRTL